MTKVLTVATEVQKVVFEEVILPEIMTGFWKHARPADHGDAWRGVSVNIGVEFGTSGFDVPRNYNFVNPEFFSKNEDRLFATAKTVNPDITVKQLKKQLIALNQILGGRLKKIGDNVTKLSRGRKNGADQPSPTKSAASAKNSVRRVAVNFVEMSESSAVENTV